MKKLVLLIAIASFLPLSFGKEVPGKSVLFPHNEIQEINYGRSNQAEVNAGHNSFRVKISERRSSKIKVFSFKDIKNVTVLQQIPRLRGRLIDVYDDQDKAYLTKTFVRIQLKRKNRSDVSDIYLSLDFNISKKEQMKLLEEDITKINSFGLSSLPVALSHVGIYDRLQKYKKTFKQYPLDLSDDELEEFLRIYISNLNVAARKAFHTETNNSSTVFFRSLDQVLKRSRGEDSIYSRNSRLHRRGRSERRYNRLRMEERLKNPWLLEQNLADRGLNLKVVDWRSRRLDDEFCFRSNYQTVDICPKTNTVNSDLVVDGTKPTEYDFYKNRLIFLKSYVEKTISEFQGLIRSRLKKDPDYIHRGMQEKLDGALDKLLLADNLLLKMDDYLEVIELDEGLDLQNTINRFRAVIWSSYLKTLLENNDYDEIRFFDEGGFYHQYPQHFVKDSVKSVQRMTDAVQPFNWSLQGLETLGMYLSNQSLLSIEEAKEIEKNFIATDLETLGTGLGEGLVNILGQIFKKRKWVPYIRVSTMFRESFMTKRRKFVFENFFAEDGMKPGDIILEKDMKANTDVLIPGYWVHAAIYMGTIKDMKRMGLWDHPDFNIIQYELEKYRTSKDRQYYLNDEWGNELPFEEVPWFYESDRTGVAVHPLHKFLYTDGVAVLRPNGKWGKKEIMDVYKRANERMYFPYDYVHNTRNKFYVSCSKVVLKVFNNVTFPVSKNLNYISVSPDQIGQPVALKEEDKDKGELKLIMFFDALDKGNLNYHYNKPETFKNYGIYLEASGLK